MRPFAAIFLALVLGSCAEPAPAPEPSETVAQQTAPPPLPEGAETVEFERTVTAEETSAAAQNKTPDAGSDEPTYWGIKPGEALTLMWEDLMPEGAEEQLMREYEEFYAMLDKRYSANMTTLADADPYGGIAEGSDLDYMPQFGTFEVVEDLDGELVRIPGYIVPFDFNLQRRHSEFLFVPYMGACIHTPPPPPNQIVYVRADPAVRIKDIWDPYWVEGTLSVERNDNELGDAAYALTLDVLDPYPMP
ncbi:MAG: DUF3299 domain-containing protein [Henriciella sp.]|nr:DUF3299 domain-containing protein [Henriciella sp.]